MHAGRSRTTTHFPPRLLGLSPPPPPPPPRPGPTPCTPVSFVSVSPPCSAMRLFVSSSANLRRSSFVECCAGSTVDGGGGTFELGGVGTSYWCGSSAWAGAGGSMRFGGCCGRVDDAGGAKDGPDRIRLVAGAPYGSEEWTSSCGSALDMYPCRILSSRSRTSMSAIRLTRVD